MIFQPFPNIEGFHNVIKAVAAYPHLCPTPVTYRGKIKLHGTNAGVRICNGEIAAQSRTQIITPTNDNLGFAKWVESKKDFFFYFKDAGKLDTTIYGEWAGKGIQKGTAINQIPKKIFAIFAVLVDDMMVTSPRDIEGMLGTLPDDIYVLPWQGEEFTVDFTDRDGLQKTADNLNAIIEKLEPSDPWVKATFGVDGVAEGIVYVPGAGAVVTRKHYSDLAFKAKGEKHKVNKTKEAVQVDPETLASIGEFVTMFATEPRFEQGVAAIGGLNIKQIGAFLKWIGEDVLKESEDELEASGLEWSDVQKSIQAAARDWFIQKVKTI